MPGAAFVTDLLHDLETKRKAIEVKQACNPLPAGILQVEKKRQQKRKGQVAKKNSKDSSVLDVVRKRRGGSRMRGSGVGRFLSLIRE